MTRKLNDLMNVGKATLSDLEKLSITSVEQLATCDADDLYRRLQAITASKHDPCVWDIFAAIIHEAKTGVKKPWWEWSKIRKKKTD